MFQHGDLVLRQKRLDRQCVVCRRVNGEYMENPTRVEAGSNPSTVTLRVVRGDEMGLKKAAP
jgi:hypothetical protein